MSQTHQDINQREKIHSPKKKLIRLYLFSWLLIFPVTLLLSLDSFGNSETVAKLTGISSYQCVIPTLVIVLAYRRKLGSFLSFTLKKLLTIGFVLTSLVGSVLTFYDALTPSNAAFALTRLHQDRLILLAVFLGVVLLANQSTDWWRKYWSNILLLIPFAGFYVLFLTSLFPFDVFLQLVKEDHLIEYGQFWVLLLGSIGALWISWRLKRAQQLVWSLFFGLCFLAFFFVAGDEISWGQRILGIEVSEAIKQVNHQDEMTVHNLYAVEWLVVYGYFGISLFGVFAHVVCSRFAPLKRVSRYVPSKLLIGYFLLPLIFYAAQLLVTGGIWHPWAEVSELYFYIGIVLWILLLGQGKISDISRA